MRRIALSHEDPLLLMHLLSKYEAHKGASSQRLGHCQSGLIWA